MSKRFFDTEIWEKEWFGELSTKQKLLVFFLFAHCDCAGVYDPNYRNINFYTGEKITEKDILQIKQIIKLPNGKFFLTDFIKFQYGADISNLNPNFTVHRGVIRILEKNNIMKLFEKINNDGNFETVKKELENSSTTVQDKDKDKDKDKNKNKDKLKEVKIFGEFENVVLTPDQETKLKELYGKDFGEAVEYLSSYIQSSGKKYKCHYAVLGKHNWVYKRVYGENGRNTKLNTNTNKTNILRQAEGIF